MGRAKDRKRSRIEGKKGGRRDEQRKDRQENETKSTDENTNGQTDKPPATPTLGHQLHLPPPHYLKHAGVVIGADCDGGDGNNGWW
jgi:hypothetical protein